MTTESGDVHAIPGPNPKLQAMLGDIDTLPKDQSVIVWACFRAEVEAIVAALQTEYGRDSAGAYYGQTSATDRAELLKSFQAGKTRFFVGTQQAGGMGLTLTAASIAYYFSNSSSAIQRWQSADRNYRIGQKRRVLYKDLIMLGTLDRKILSALQSHKDLADLLTGDGQRLAALLEA